MAAPRVTAIDRTMISVPFHPRTAMWTKLLAAHWGLVEVVRVTTDDPDIVGWGETLVDYTWARVTDEAVRRVVGRPVAELLFFDDLGAGLQMALADAAGKAAEVPVHRLLSSPQVRDAVPISWWCADLPPALLAEEAADAVSQGYTSLKLKARPWFDVVDQVKAVAEVTPAHFKLDIDWNSTLLTVDEALPVLRELDQYDRVGMYESPVRRQDITGQRFIRERVQRPLAEHYNPATFESVIRADCVDGFVAFGGGLTGMLDQGIRMAAFAKPFWLQIVGTALTTAFTAHLGAVLTHARWPAITALNTFDDDLVTTPLQVSEGFLPVPTAPGLGIEVDESAIERLALPDGVLPEAPRALLTVRVPGRPDRTYGQMDDLWRDSEVDGRYGGHPRGAVMDVLLDDGSETFNSQHRDRLAAVVAPHRVRGY